MSQKLPVNDYKWIEDTSKINEKFIKNYDKIMIKVTFWKWMLNIQRDYINYTLIYHSYQKE